MTRTNELWSAILNPAGPNYQTWHDALGSDRVSLISPRSIRTNLEAEERVEAYLLDLRALTLGQRARLLSAVAKRLGVPVYEVESEVARVGFPIRAADVIVSISLRAVI